MASLAAYKPFVKGEKLRSNKINHINMHCVLSLLYGNARITNCGEFIVCDEFC